MKSALARSIDAPKTMIMLKIWHDHAHKLNKEHRLEDGVASTF
jgi:hypothetical protein